MDPKTTPTAKPEEWKLIVTIIGLLFFTPLGIIFMWLWMKNWPLWLKILLTILPLIFALLVVGIIGAVFLAIPRDEWKSTNDYDYSISSPAPATDSSNFIPEDPTTPNY